VPGSFLTNTGQSLIGLIQVSFIFINIYFDNTEPIYFYL
jgi:hypothetical protein